MGDLPAAAFDCLPSPIVVVDAKRRVLHANRAAVDLIGDGGEGLDLAHRLRHPRVLDAVDEVLNGAAERIGEFDLPVPVARHIAFRVERLAGAPATDGSVAVLTLDDMTAAKKAEEMRADFVANVSHELRSPLTALLGFVETLRGPASDDSEARTKFLSIMLLEARRMARLIDDLLSLSRVEINEHVAPKGDADVRNVLGNVVDVLEPQAAARGITLEFETASVPAPVIGDADQLNQVFRNLIENAIKYGGTGKAVSVKIFAAERMPGTNRNGVGVSITDRGPGIPKELIPRLTERFFRIDKARTQDASGLTSTGLGLAIVKHIVSRHRGHLSIESQIGEGSTFTVYLPTRTA
ncbi:MAG: ATP-binding protein [Proteobacteria bacterium]|nr:ATP-binding protein [Pseudomonadota bacterium]